MTRVIISADHSKATIHYETHSVTIYASQGESIIDLVMQLLSQSQNEAA